MKIAIFSDNFYPEISGISDSVISLGKQLALKGHEVHFFAAKYAPKDYQKANIELGEPDLGPNVKFHRFWSLPMFGSPTGQSRIVIPFGLRCLKFKAENFDLIYTQSPYGMGVEALLMSRMFDIPLIGTNHTPITEFTRYLPLSNKLFDYIGLKFVSWYYNRCRFVSAPYVGILQEMKQYGFKKECEAISNPIDLKNFVSVASEEKARLKEKFAFTDKTVLYAGRLAPEKQVDIIIRAIAQVKKVVPEAMLAITGIGNAEDDLKKLAQELKISDSVKFLGRVDDQTHAETYQAAEMFAVMSTAETQCMSMMKAMSVGMPVMGADAWALPNYIGRDEKVGFVIPVGDIETLAEKMMLLMQNQELAKTMGQAGMAHVAQFSAEGVAQKWEQIFKKHALSEAKNKKLKLSFVVPAYNEEHYVGKSLASIFEQIAKSQRREDIEVIVVDNASTDKTAEVIKSFSGAKYVYESAKGLVRARNAGYQASTGDIIANVDSDSTLPDGWIDKVFDSFLKDEEIVALSGPYVYPESSKLVNWVVKMYYRIGYAGHLFNQYVLNSGAVLQGGNFVIRRTAMEKIGGYDTTIEFYGEDTDVARRIQKVGKVTFTFDLPMNTSSRRFAGEGLITTGAKYVINHFWTIIFKKPFSQQYKDFRQSEKVISEIND